MAILHHKEEKIQVVLGRLPKEYTHEQFVEMFIKLYSKDWGKIKSAYIKQSQDKEPGTVINMPKPDLYLKQLLETYVAANPSKVEIVKKTPIKAEPAKEKTPVVKAKAAAKKKEVIVTDEEVVKKPKAIAKKKIVEETVELAVKEVKKKNPAKKKVEAEVVAPTRAKKVKSTEK
jgi:hypothetical protein